MILRRFFEHTKTQNWVALILDLLVVVVGIYLAFQVDRWTDQRRQERQEQIHLAALAQDFEANREVLLRAKDRFQSVIDSSVEMLSYDSETQQELSHDEFYDLLQGVVAGTTISFVSKTYDSLVTSGEIEGIGDPEFRSSLAEFYSWLDTTNYGELERTGRVWYDLLLPFITSELDHTALMIHAHPEISHLVEPSRPVDQFRDIVGTEHFEGMVTARWHQIYDQWLQIPRLLGQIERIEEQIAANQD